MKPRILTVGDGDLSLSLSLARAYGKYISLTASVLDDSKEELLKGYPDAPIYELQTSNNVSVLFGLDATQIHQKFPKDSFDLVCFHHPHLGLASLGKNEAEHANRHFQLLCHYLDSAKQVSNLVHVCLCGTQPETWRLLKASKFSQTTLLAKLPTTVPFCQLWTKEAIEAAPAQSHFAAPRRYRNGRLGSRHMLGKYGYRHRRTEGERYKGTLSDMNVAGSMHFVFQPFKSTTEKNKPSSPTQCPICQVNFASKASLAKHLKSPAMPDITPTTREQDTTKRGKTNQQVSIPCITIDQTDRKGQQLQVTEPCNTKRLRWFIQHGIQGLSKRQADLTIQTGLVTVNNEKVLDSSRILVTGDTVFVPEVSQTKSMLPPSSSSSSSTKLDLEISYRKPPILVVFKPSGVRTKGQFPNTLEATISEQEGIPYSSLSSLDTSSAGLCVLMQSRQQRDTPLPTVLHSMTALVYGNVPDSWIPCRNVTVTFEPKWKKKRKQADMDSHVQHESVKLFPITQDPSMPLSTICIQTKNPCAASLCRFLRLDGYGVVGDVYCRQEYLKLKRSIRNRIKDKLCIGCYQVEIDGVEIKKDIPDKLMATFWASHFET